ncbi:MAG: hypothetical protein MI725_10970, partial [Pirellulales bacterium]|nr:hypothetical protein [Pirellulales bacterium]
MPRKPSKNSHANGDAQTQLSGKPAALSNGSTELNGASKAVVEDDELKLNGRLEEEVEESEENETAAIDDPVRMYL